MHCWGAHSLFYHCQEANAQHRQTTTNLLGLNLLGANSSVWSAHLGSSSRTFQMSRFIFQPYEQTHWWGSIHATTRVAVMHTCNTVCHTKTSSFNVFTSVMYSCSYANWHEHQEYKCKLWLTCCMSTYRKQNRGISPETEILSSSLISGCTQSAHDCTLHCQPHAQSIACQKRSHAQQTCLWYSVSTQLNVNQCFSPDMRYNALLP